jgi:hypothetical protein
MPVSATRPAAVALPLAFVLTGLAALLVGTGWLLARPALLTTYHYNQYIIALTHLFVLGWIGSIVMGAMYQLVPVALESQLHSQRLASWQWAFHVVGFAGMAWMFAQWNLKQVGHFGCLFAIGGGLFVYNLARTLGRARKWNATAAAMASALVWLAVAIVAGLSIATGKCSYETAAGGALTGGLLHGLRVVGGFMAQFDAISAMHAHAHLGVIGCFTMLIVGVSYKLIPMFALSEVQSARRAAWSVALLNLGLAGSFITVLLRSPWKVGCALLIVASLALYGWEVIAILRARNRRSLDWGMRYFLTALAWLAPLSALALLLSWPGLPLNPLTGQLENLYGFVGLLGVISFAIIGMLYKIIPFLIWLACYSPHVGRQTIPALADLYSARAQAWGYWSYLAGIVVISVGIISANQTSVRWGCGLLAFSLGTLTFNVVRMLSHLVRPRLHAKRHGVRQSSAAFRRSESGKQMESGRGLPHSLTLRADSSE